jgi:hypothetical protein
MKPPISRDTLEEWMDELDEAEGHHEKGHDWAVGVGYQLLRAYEKLAFPNERPLRGSSEPPTQPPPPPQPKRILNPRKK